MNELFWQTLLFGIARWAHLVAVVMGIGGAFTMRYVLLPSIHDEDPTIQASVLAQARRCLSVIIPAAVGLLLVSGVINIVRAFAVAPAPPVVYHILLTVKLLAAFALFFFAIMLIVPGDRPNAFQRNPRLWMTMNAHLGFLIMAFSVALRFLSGK